MKEENWYIPGGVIDQFHASCRGWVPFLDDLLGSTLVLGVGLFSNTRKYQGTQGGSIYEY